MKKLYIAITACCLATSAWAQPKMKFDQDAKEFGTVLWANPATAVFQVTNTGNAPLVITDVHPSCACTVVDWPNQAIKPGASAKIQAVFDAKALGTFYKELEITSNASAEPTYLQLKGRVVATAVEGESTEGFDIVMGDVRLSKDAIEFDQVTRGSEPVEEISILNTSRATFEPVLMHLPDYLEVSAFPARIPGGRSGRLRIKLNTDKIHDMGLTQTSVYLTRFYGDKVCEDNEIDVSAILLPDFSEMTTAQRALAPKLKLSTQQIDIPLVKKTKGKGVVLVSNVGQSDLKIDRLQVFSSAISVSIPKKVIKAGETVKMKVTVLKSKLRKNRKPRILMITNDPSQAELIIRIKTD